MVPSLPIEAQREAEKYYSLILFFYPRVAFFYIQGPFEWSVLQHLGAPLLTPLGL